MSILINGKSLFQSLSCHTFKFNINFEKCNKEKLSSVPIWPQIGDLLASVPQYAASDDFSCVFDIIKLTFERFFWSNPGCGGADAGGL